MKHNTTKASSATKMVSQLNKNIGKRVRQRRVELGIPRTFIAEKVGVSQQQFEKYEKGTNRISVGMMIAIANHLEVELHYFFDGLTGHIEEHTSKQQRMLMELAQNFQQIDDDRHKKLVLLASRVLKGEDAEDALGQ